jgi:murein DD-endopeptidase MepM/ murein hydrolase activator NlpD
VAEGEQIAACGNSGNSTQPHLHLQVMDSADLAVARGVPMSFRRFRSWIDRASSQVVERGVPDEGAVVEPLPVPSPAAGS